MRPFWTKTSALQREQRKHRMLERGLLICIVIMVLCGAALIFLL
jgi:hypothetical protein